MKIAVTGSNGLLGQHLLQLLLESGHELLALGKGADRTSFSSNPAYRYYDADITDKESIQRILIAENPGVVIHAAAITQVDDCELNRASCELVNCEGTKNVIAAAASPHQHLIYISTDFVFDGEKGNYSEEDITSPVSFYGYTKQLCEELVKQCTIPWAIVRTCLVYGSSLSGTRSNIITWVKKSLEEGKAIKVVNDQFRTPTYVEDLAKGIAAIAIKKATGIFHLSGKDLLTPYDMAVATAEYFNLDKNRIEKVNASLFTQPAKRPPKTGFNISKARKELGYEPVEFREGLKKMFQGRS